MTLLARPFTLLLRLETVLWMWIVKQGRLMGGVGSVVGFMFGLRMELLLQEQQEKVMVLFQRVQRFLGVDARFVEVQILVYKGV